MHIITLCGSLRQHSVNAELLDTLGSMKPEGTTVARSQLIPLLPLFNPDLMAELPAVVAAFEAEIRKADVVVIASPEYAHGISGVMKNALDWLVGSEVFVNKAVAVLNAAVRAQHADAALREVLSMMSVQLLVTASLSIPVAPTSRGKLADDPVIQAQLQKVWQAIQTTASEQRP